MVSQQKPLRGSSYLPLADKIKHSLACIHITNEDN